MPSWSSSTPQASRYCSKLLSAKRGRGVGSWDTKKELKTWSPRAPSRAQPQSPTEKDGGQNEAGRSFTAFAANSRPIWRSTFLMKPTLHWAGVLGTLAFALLTMITACAQTIWTEGWQAAQTRTYVVTDTTEDAIFGDRGGWIVYDSAPDCNGAPHPNTAEIISVADNKILKMTVVANDCVADLSVDLFSSPNVPISTNTLISFTQTGSLANPHWNGFFPTLFPPPGDNIHLSLPVEGTE